MTGDEDAPEAGKPAGQPNACNIAKLFGGVRGARISSQHALAHATEQLDIRVRSVAKVLREVAGLLPGNRNLRVLAQEFAQRCRAALQTPLSNLV